MKEREINTKNYFETVDDIGITTLPSALKQFHQVISEATDNGNDWTKYTNDKSFKKMSDLAFKKLQEYINSTGLNGTAMSGKKGGSYLTPRMVAIEVARPYLLNGGDNWPELWVKHPVIDEHEFSAHVEGEKVIVTMLYGTEIHDVFTFGELKDDVVKHYGKYTQKRGRRTFNHKQPEYKILKAILAWHNRNISKSMAKQFINELKAYWDKKQLTKKSPAYNEIQLIQEKLEGIYKTMGDSITIQLNEETRKSFRAALKKVTDKNKGLAGIPSIESQKENTPADRSVKDSDILRSSDFVKMEFPSLGFKDKWRGFIGDPCAGFTVMVFGMPKMGKSYLCVDFAGYLARNHGRVLYVAKEEKAGSTLQDKFKEKNVAHDNLEVTGALPANLAPYDFIFLDSVNKLRLKPEDLEALKKKYKGKSFIYIFQATKGGQFKGNNEFQHDVDVVIEIPEKGKAVQYGRFNQGGQMDIFETNMNAENKEDNQAEPELPVQEDVPALYGTKKEDIKKQHKKKSTKEGERDWTEPEYLSASDHQSLKIIKSFYEKGQYKEAMNYASNVDTIVREEIPGEIWKAIGGKLTPAGEARMKKKMGKAQEKKPDQYSGRGDDLNPHLMFAGMPTQLLAEALKGEFDVFYLIRRELANRGVDQEGNWVGFDEAKRIHQIE